MDLYVDRAYKGLDFVISNLFVNGREFCYVLEDTDRGLNSSMSEITIRRDKIYGKTAIPTGLYRITLDVKSPRFGDQPFYQKVCGGYLPRLENVKGYNGVLIHCLTPDTEILTEYGWQNLESFKQNTPSKCFSYNIDNQCIELVDINFLIENEYNGKLYCCDGRRVNYEVTDKHKMWVGSLKREGGLQWKFRDADSLTKQSYFLTSAIKKDGWELTSKQKVLYRLIMAVQADGYILNWSKSASQVKFHFTKERKIERVKQLVNQLGGTYKIMIDSEMKTNIILDNKTSELITEIMNPYRELRGYKELPIELLNLKSEDLKDLVLEYLFWDGRYENYLRNNKNMIITSTNTRTLNILQAMCALCGIRAYMKLELAKKGNHSYCYDLILYENQQVVVPEPYTYNTKEYSGTVWCINNCNHTILIRKNGRTMIIGNCGNTIKDTDGCLLVGLYKDQEKGMVTHSKDAFSKLYPLLKEADARGEEIWIQVGKLK